MACLSKSNDIPSLLFQKSLGVTEVDPQTLAHQETRGGDLAGKSSLLFQCGIDLFLYFYYWETGVNYQIAETKETLLNFLKKICGLDYWKPYCVDYWYC